MLLGTSCIIPLSVTTGICCFICCSICSLIPGSHYLIKLFFISAGGYAANVVTSAQQKESSEHVEILDGASDEVRSQTLPLNLQAADSLRGSCSSTVSVTSLCRNLMLKCSSSFKSQSQFSILIVITIAVILLLMQVCFSICAFYLRLRLTNLLPQTVPHMML